jgi:hypothetical protein
MGRDRGYARGDNSKGTKKRNFISALTPAMAAGVTNRLWSLEKLVEQTSRRGRYGLASMAFSCV